MKINTLKFFTLAFLLIFTSPAFAQKFGYLNSQALLSELPEVKQADANLQALQAPTDIVACALLRVISAPSKVMRPQETLQPILDKVNNIIKQVAVENQFTYIFDSSAGILLYAQESMDVTTLVKTKLGI